MFKISRVASDLAKRQMVAFLVLCLFAFIFLAQNAMAALPSGVTTAITDAQADIVSAGSLVTTVAVVIAGFFWLRRLFR